MLGNHVSESCEKWTCPKTTCFPHITDEGRKWMVSNCHRADLISTQCNASQTGSLSPSKGLGERPDPCSLLHLAPLLLIIAPTHILLHVYRQSICCSQPCFCQELLAVRPQGWTPQAIINLVCSVFFLSPQQRSIEFLIGSLSISLTSTGVINDVSKCRLGLRMGKEGRGWRVEDGSFNLSLAVSEESEMLSCFVLQYVVIHIDFLRHHNSVLYLLFRGGMWSVPNGNLISL